MSGQLNRIDAMFAAKRAAGESAMIFYVTAGFPDEARCERTIIALAEAGADLIEVGIPFSDPVADGPTIQKSSKVALDGGMTVRRALDSVARVRKQTEAPMIFFSAYNPIAHFGVEAFADAAAAAGADGLLIPDLPPEEAGELEPLCADRGLKLVFLVAPTTTPERRKLIGRHSTGFVYYISLRGVTGARESIATDLAEKIGELKEVTDLPIAVGFGVSRREHVALIARHADGVVVGSALIDLIGRHSDDPDLATKVGDFARDLIAGLPRGTSLTSLS